MNLTIKQTEALDTLENNETNVLLFGGGAGGGKSLLGCYWILKNCFKYPKTRWLIGRAKLHTLKSTTLNTLFEVMKMQGIGVADYKYNSLSGFMQFKNGSEIVLKDLFYYPSDPHYDKLGSMEISGAFVDEASEIKQKAYMILSSRIRYQLDENNIIPKILLTCNPTKNWLYNDFYKPAKDGELETHKSFIQSLVTDNPNISKHYEAQLRRLDRVSRERLLNGNWEYDDTKNKLYNYDAINDIFSNDYIEKGEWYLSIDIARFGSDSSVVCLWSGFRCESVYRYRKISITELADNITEIINKYRIRRSNIIADEDGVGGGLCDMLKCKGFLNNGRALGGENYANLKSQCYYKFADKVNAGEIFVKADMEIKNSIIQELEVVEMKDMDKETRLSVISKDKIKENIGRSPDFADALMMRMFFEVGEKNRITYYG